MDSPELELDVCELLCGFWELQLGSLEEQLMLLTPEPSLQPPAVYFKIARGTILNIPNTNNEFLSNRDIVVCVLKC